MASVAWQGTSPQPRDSRILDLDEGSGLPQWLQVTGGFLIIVGFLVLVALWLKPVSPPNLILDARPSTGVLTVPAIRSLAPETFTSAPSGLGPQIFQQLPTDTMTSLRKGT